MWIINERDGLEVIWDLVVVADLAYLILPHDRYAAFTTMHYWGHCY